MVELHLAQSCRTVDLTRDPFVAAFGKSKEVPSMGVSKGYLRAPRDELLTSELAHYRLHLVASTALLGSLCFAQQAVVDERRQSFENDRLIVFPSGHHGGCG